MNTSSTQAQSSSSHTHNHHNHNNTQQQQQHQHSTSCESALTLACENGHTDVVDALIKAGADPNQGDPDKGFTPLMKASRAGQFCTVQYLLTNCSATLDINRTTLANEHSALSLACQNGHLAIVELLLQHGANPLDVFKDNSNCLIEAAKGGHTKIVELLIDWNYTLTQQQQMIMAAAAAAATSGANAVADVAGGLNGSAPVPTSVPAPCDHHHHHHHHHDLANASDELTPEVTFILINFR